MIIIMYPTAFYAEVMVNKGHQEYQWLIDKFNEGDISIYDDRIAYSIIKD